MNIINNTCVEVLPALLNKTKNSTIRKAWSTEHDGDCFNAPYNYWDVPKPAKYKVGDVCEMIWDEKSEYTIFAKSIGKGIFKQKVEYNTDLFFHKNLGKIEIIEVYKIKIHKLIIDDDINGLKESYAIENYSQKEDLFDGKIIAKKDGFESAHAMFKYLDDIYDLSTPKEFWVYEYRWL